MMIDDDVMRAGVKFPPEIDASQEGALIIAALALHR